jgi:hypothetical protein
MLDGDMAGGIVPNEQVKKVLTDPFGLEMLINGQAHVNPNRFFPHFIFKYYFRIVPQFLQFFVNPVESIYLAAAIIKLFTHVGIIYLLSAIATRSKSVFSVELIFVAVLLTSFFQAYGYNTDIGIIDISITYVFFYALPLLLLLLFVYFVYFSIINGKIGSIYSWIFLLLLTFILPFTGGIVPPTIILLFGTFVFIYLLDYVRNRNRSKEEFTFNLQQIPKSLIIICCLLVALSFYSLYIGSYDNQFSKESIPILKRYPRLWIGFNKTFLSKSGFTSLYHLILLNSVLIFVFLKLQRQKYFRILLGVLIFSIAYLALLPLGGYRPYRPDIIRYDSIMPITLVLFFLCAFTTIKSAHVLQTNKIYFSIYLIIIGVIIYSYTNKDDEIKLNHACEKSALITISKSKSKIVELENDCYILSWWEIRNYNDSKENGKLLKIFGVTQDAKMYYSIEDKQP